MRQLFPGVFIRAVPGKVQIGIDRGGVEGLEWLNYPYFSAIGDATELLLDMADAAWPESSPHAD